MRKKIFRTPGFCIRNYFLILFFLFIALLTQGCAGKEVTLESLLEEMVKKSK